MPSLVDAIYVAIIYVDRIYIEGGVVTEFVGRVTELALLDRRLERVSSSGSGLAVAIRGRRQVGKSRLVQEFCDRAGAPFVFFTATKGMSASESVRAFLEELRDSAVPTDPDLVPSPGAGGWPDAFRVLAGVLPDTPCVVVIDELPWLAEQDDAFDGALQNGWDRLLAKRPVLLLLLGSDIHMMERLTAYDRPFFGRADNLVLGPFNPAETGLALGLERSDAIDAALITGGLPGIVRSWSHATPPMAYLERECADPASPLFGVPESALMAEFPSPDMSRRVVESVGAGDRTYANIAAAIGNQRGGVPSGTLTPILRTLVEQKHVLAIEQPLSTRPSKPALYRIADSNLRLYLAVLRSAHEQTRRGHPEAAFRLIERRWLSWRGRAVEPLVREALAIAARAGSLPWTEVEAVGGWWNRQFDPEIDLVGADRSPVARKIQFVGSIKWLASAFDDHDLARLRSGAAAVPGVNPGEAETAIVSLSGISSRLDSSGITLVWGPGDVMAAWS